MPSSTPLWMALLLSPPSGPDAAGAPAAAQAVDAVDQRQAMAWWALQFTPKVALAEEGVLLELSASRRLFGGEQVLRERVCAEALAMGCAAVGWGPTATGTLALTRCGVTDGFAQPLNRLLDQLPMSALPGVAVHAPILARTGCKTLGDVRRLPRGGLSRRFTKSLLLALDQAYGLQPVAFDWVLAPELFQARLELPGRVEAAEGLLFGARRLLTQMAGWLAARHAGITAFTLRFKHDFHRASEVPDWGEVTIRTAEATREMSHFTRLLGERLGHVQLGAPVEELVLVAGTAVPLEEVSGSLLQEKTREGESALQLLERLAERLGPGAVVRAEVRSDYRPEWAQEWVSATVPPSAHRAPLPDVPQPTWLIAKPLPLAMRRDQPAYQGALTTVAGPYRVEAAWWDRSHPDAIETGEPQPARRDYYVMASEHGGLLWVYRDLAPSPAGKRRWFLHGIFG